eukprot:evm.model.scf_3049.2 EVM.evm.TU.scf_3049.2   scf_3049:9184-9358(+)
MSATPSRRRGQSEESPSGASPTLRNLGLRALSPDEAKRQTSRLFAELEARLSTAKGRS